MPVAASFPSIHVTGPVHIFARTPAAASVTPPDSAAIWYVGTCETQPQVKHAKQRIDVFNDIGGRKVPFQQIEQGEIGLIGLLLTRFSQAAYTAIRLAGRTDGDGADAGAGVGYESSFARGAFSLGRTSVELWLLFQFGFGADVPGQAGIATTPGLPRGRYYPTALLTNHEIADSGSADEKLLLTFTALPLWLGTAGVGSKNRGFGLYSEDEADFPVEIVNGSIQ